MMSDWRKSVKWGLVGAGLSCLVISVLFSAPFYPPFRKGWVMDDVVAVVALDWRDFGRLKAEERLLFELEQRDLPGTMESYCQLKEESRSRIVQCAWQELVVLPVVSSVVPLSFDSIAIVKPEGELLRQ